MAKKTKVKSQNSDAVVDNTAVSIFVVILVELTNTVFVNSTNITTNIETVALSTWLTISDKLENSNLDIQGS